MLRGTHATGRARPATTRTPCTPELARWRQVVGVGLTSLSLFTVLVPSDQRTSARDKEKVVPGYPCCGRPAPCHGSPRETEPGAWWGLGRFDERLSECSHPSSLRPLLPELREVARGPLSPSRCPHPGEKARLLGSTWPSLGMAPGILW